MHFDPLSPVPEYELNLLCLAVSEAIAFAASARPADGFTILLLGLERVQDYPDPWAAQLVFRWQLSMDRYCQLFGVQGGPTLDTFPLNR